MRHHVIVHYVMSAEYDPAFYASCADFAPCAISRSGQFDLSMPQYEAQIGLDGSGFPIGGRGFDAANSVSRFEAVATCLGDFVVYAG